MQDGKTKIYYLEVLRAVSAVSVVLLHILAGGWYGYIGSASWIYITVFNGLVRFCVPVFFMISGALYLRKETELHIKKKIVRMLVFLLFWAMVYQIYNNCLQHNESNILFVSIKNILHGDTQTHLWYIYALIGIYLFLPIVKIFTDNASKKQLLYAIFLLLFLNSILPIFAYMGNIGQSVLANFNKLYISGTGKYMCYILIGHYLHSYEVPKKICNIIYVSSVLGIAYTIIMTITTCMQSMSCNELYWGYLMPCIVLWSVALFLFAKNTFVEAKANIWKDMVQFISNISLGLYGVHQLIIDFISRVGFSVLSFNVAFSIPILLGVVVVLSAVIIVLIKKIPILGKFIA